MMAWDQNHEFTLFKKIFKELCDVNKVPWAS